MSENPGRRRNIPADPTAEPVSDPVPADDVVMPSDDSTLNTQI